MSTIKDGMDKIRDLGFLQGYNRALIDLSGMLIDKTPQQILRELSQKLDEKYKNLNDEPMPKASE